MKTFILRITPEADRNHWRKEYKRLIGTPAYELDKFGWWGNLCGMALGEIVKNICDHANTRGTVILSVSERRVVLIAYDYGPGYNLSKQDVGIEAIAQHHFNNGSSKQDSNNNMGQGLHHILGLFKGIGTHSDRPPKGSFINITTKGRFRYHCAWWW